MYVPGFVPLGSTVDMVIGAVMEEVPVYISDITA